MLRGRRGAYNHCPFALLLRSAATPLRTANAALAHHHVGWCPFFDCPSMMMTRLEGGFFHEFVFKTGTRPCDHHPLTIQSPKTSKTKFWSSAYKVGPVGRAAAAAESEVKCLAGSFAPRDAARRRQIAVGGAVAWWTCGCCVVLECCA